MTIIRTNSLDTSVRMDRVLAIDRVQADESRAVRCGFNGDHGRLTAHRDGQALLCSQCNYVAPASEIING